MSNYYCFVRLKLKKKEKDKKKFKKTQKRTPCYLRQSSSSVWNKLSLLDSISWSLPVPSMSDTLRAPYFCHSISPTEGKSYDFCPMLAYSKHKGAPKWLVEKAMSQFGSRARASCFSGLTTASWKLHISQGAGLYRRTQHSVGR